MLLTAAVIADRYKQESDFLKSLSFADEVIIISNNKIPASVDNGKFKYFHHTLDGDFAGQRNFALTKAKGDWVLFVDTDEVVSKQLSSEILEVLPKSKHSGYFLKRLDTCYHIVQLYGEIGNTKILRLARRKSGKFMRPVHETWQVSGSVGELKNVLYHTKDHFVSEFIPRISFYGPIDAIKLNEEGKVFNFFRLLAYPIGKFFRNYFYLYGFLDGHPGLFHAYLMAVQSLSVRVYQWTIQKYSSV